MGVAVDRKVIIPTPPHPTQPPSDRNGKLRCGFLHAWMVLLHRLTGFPLLLFSGFPNIYEVPHGSKRFLHFQLWPWRRRNVLLAMTSAWTRKLAKMVNGRTKLAVEDFLFLVGKPVDFKQGIFFWLEEYIPRHPNTVPPEVWCFIYIFGV